MKALPKILFRVISVVLTVPFFFFLFSCSPSKYVTDGSYLLKKNVIETEEKDVSKSGMKNYILQKPNKRILGVRLNLFYYNLSNLNKKGWPHGWLRRIGEEPVVFDPDLTSRTKQQLKTYLQNKGYFFAEVNDSIKIRGNNATVVYKVISNEPYRVRNIRYLFEDTSIVSFILGDTVNSLLIKGMLFDKEVLQKERIRIEELMKRNGFYKFSKEYIYFDAEAIKNELLVDLTLGIKENLEGRLDRITMVRPHYRYIIDDLAFHPDFNTLNHLSNADDTAGDTLDYENTRFIFIGRHNIRPQVIYNHTYILPGKMFDIRNTDRSYRNLSSLGLFKFININFIEPKELIPDSSGFIPLGCSIELTQKKTQSYQHEIVGTNSNGDLGVRYNLLYQNLNFFRGAETFNFKMTAAFEALKYAGLTNLSNTLELGTELRLEIPKFFLPLKSTEFVKRYSPKTLFSLAINHRIEKQYVRTYANASFGYTWRGNRYLRHSIFPFELNFVQVDEVRSKAFLEEIDSTYLEYSFTDHLVSVSRYTLEYNTQEIGREKDFVYLKINLESAGNSLYALNEVTKSRKEEDGYQLFNVRFSQYVKTDLEFKYFWLYNARNTVVFRGFAGIGYPFGNSAAMPFEKKYFAGGPNSVRAWNAYSLGPNSSQWYENTGDIKLEFNFEYRFKLFWKLEGALFADAGNIWDIHFQETRLDAVFRFDRFYNDIAIGTGFGTRFDFGIFLLRFDFAMKTRDPFSPQGDKFVIFQRKPVIRDDFNIQFGIGYPF
ncbi:MAG: BamA/TamA family outer membrane protein [Bacteroidales bacterium]